MATPSSSTSPRDRCAWLLAITALAGTLAFCGCWIWWMQHPPTNHASRGALEMAQRIASGLGRQRWASITAFAGCAALLVAGVLLVVRRPWGYAAVLPCAVALLVAATATRYVAVFSEPRSFVERSTYVRAATALWWPLLLSQLGLAALALRGLRSSLLATFAGPSRLALALLSVSCAGPMLLWILAPSDSTTLASLLAASALLAGGAALLAACRPRLGWMRLARIIATFVLAATVLAIAFAARTQQHHRSIFVPREATSLMFSAILTAPPVLAILALTWMMIDARRRESAPATSP